LEFASRYRVAVNLGPIIKFGQIYEFHQRANRADQTAWRRHDLVGPDSGIICAARRNNLPELDDFPSQRCSTSSSISLLVHAADHAAREKRAAIEES
jgi:hypothetical protein